MFPITISRRLPRTAGATFSVVIEGPIVAKFRRMVRAGQQLGRKRGKRPGQTVTGLARYRRTLGWCRGGGERGGAPAGGRFRWLREGHWAWHFRKDLTRAKRLDAVSAYFSPPRSFRRQFSKLARRGQVRLIMAGKSDIGAAIDMARLLYGKLLKAGASIFEFQPCKLHMKLLVVDDASYVGSANLDKRSFRINVELMVRIEDPDLAAALRKMIDHIGGRQHHSHAAMVCRDRGAVPRGCAGGWPTGCRWSITG